MATVWTVQGQVGGGMDATVRTLGTDIDATSARVVFRSCAPDTFTYTVECEAVTANIPTDNQSVTLYRNGSRFFSGFVTNRKERASATSHTVTIEVSGPWYYLDHTQVETSQPDGIGVSAPRPSALVGGNVKDIISNLINQAISRGIPISLGTVSNFFNVGNTTLNQMTYGQAISEMLRLVPDAMTWFNYSTTNPTINVTRRGFAGTTTIDITECTDFEVNPNSQLALTEVKIPYVTRAPNGRRRWQTLQAGTPTLGRIGVLVQSGPEMDTFLPDEPFDSFNITTQPTNAGVNFIRAYLNNTDPVLKQLIQQYGDSWFGNSVSFPYYTSQSGNDGATLGYYTYSNGSGFAQQTTIAPTFTINGTPVTGKHLVTSATSIPDWARSENGINVYDGYLTCDVYVVVDYSETTSNGTTFPSTTLPGVVQFSTYCWFREPQLFSGSTGNYKRRGIFIYKADLPVKLVDAGYQGTIYRQPTFVYAVPPSDLASNLLAAQNWMPYEGRISIPVDDVAVVQYRGSKINVTGTSLAAHASMGALVESEELDLMNNLTTINLGAPPRTDYKTWADKGRLTPQNNIQYV